VRIPVDLKPYQQIEALAAKRSIPFENIVSAWFKERTLIKLGPVTGSCRRARLTS
jgi:hypothetical protein